MRLHNRNYIRKGEGSLAAEATMSDKSCIALRKQWSTRRPSHPFRLQKFPEGVPPQVKMPK